MNNPWLNIDLNDYETHMQDTGVLQLQTLNQIMREQSSYQSEIVAVLGAAGGNGLEHFADADTIYAVDINADYLNQCVERHSNLNGKLETICCDIARSALPACGLLVCNLIIEYIGIGAFVSCLKRTDFEIVSCVIQKNSDNSFVSVSATAERLAPLDTFHEMIDENELSTQVGLKIILRKTYDLPNGKQLIRIDFSKR